MKTRSEGVSLGRTLPQISLRIILWVSTFPTLCASRQSSLYSIGVRWTSSPST